MVFRNIRRIPRQSPLPSSKGWNDRSGFGAGEATLRIPPSVSFFHVDFYEPLPIQIEMSDAPLTSDAGLFPLRESDKRIGSTR